jgi:hypothetical protein
LFKRHQLEDNTDNIIDKMIERTPENIVIRIGKNRFLIPVNILKDFAIKSLPDAIVDEKSENAKKYGALRSALKAGIRPFLPDILKKTWGREVEIKPHLNILSWLPLYFIHFFIGSMARLEWRIDVKDCEGCGEHVFQVLRLAPDIARQEQLTGDRQSLPGRGKPTLPGQTDHNKSGGQVGDTGDDRERQDDISKGATSAAASSLSSG